MPHFALANVLGIGISFCFFFCLALVGLLILLFAGFSATTHPQIIGWGIAGSALIFINYWLMMSLAGLNSAASGSQDSYRNVTRIMSFFFVCIVAYFTLTLLAFHFRKKRLSRSDDDP